MFAVNTYLVSNSSAVWQCQGYVWVTHWAMPSLQEVPGSRSCPQSAQSLCTTGEAARAVFNQTMAIASYWVKLMLLVLLPLLHMNSSTAVPHTKNSGIINYYFMSQCSGSSTRSRCKLEETPVALPGTSNVSLNIKEMHTIKTGGEMSTKEFYCT